MDEYYYGLNRMLRQIGYQQLRPQDMIYCKEEQEQVLLLLRIIPEPLPGQREVDFKAAHELLEKTARAVMIMKHCRVETLMVYMGSQNPGQSMIASVSDYDDVWFCDRQTERVFLYENQKPHFYGLEDALSDFMSGWNQLQKQEKMNRLRRSFTPVNTVLVLVNILVFLVLSFMGDTENANFIAEHGGMVYSYVVDLKEYYRLFTSMFVHFGIEHLGENMLVLLMLGRIMERRLGKISFLTIYILSGLISSVASLMFTLASSPETVSGGASGAICGIMGGLLFLILQSVLSHKKGRIEGISLRGILFIIIVSVGYGLLTSGVDNAAHIGGLIGGFLITGLIQLILTLRQKD